MNDMSDEDGLSGNELEMPKCGADAVNEAEQWCSKPDLDLMPAGAILPLSK